MNIAVIGSGLYSYTAAAQFAAVGNQVFLFGGEPIIGDLAESGTKENVSGEYLFEFENEPGLVSLFKRQVSQKRIHQCQPKGDAKIDFVFIADGDPFTTLTRFELLFSEITDGESCFIIVSPSHIGEAEALQKTLLDKNMLGHVVCIPLLIREGRALDDFSRPDNIIVGCDQKDRLPRIKAIFYPFNRIKDVVKVVSSKEAEFASFAGNAMLATRLSFMNEMASLAEQTGVDVDVIRECIGSDPRIGRDYLYPGCGYGGEALEDNVARVADQLKSRHDDLGLLTTIARINERQKDLLFRKIWTFYQGELRKKRVAIWGASFKPGSASLVGAPAINLIDSLTDHQVKVTVYDPMAGSRLQSKYHNNPLVKVVDQRDLAIECSDILAICTEWKEFWSPDFTLIKNQLKNKAIFDGRNLYSPDMMKAFGLKYYGVGRGDPL